MAGSVVAWGADPGHLAGVSPWVGAGAGAGGPLACPGPCPRSRRDGGARFSAHAGKLNELCPTSHDPNEPCRQILKLRPHI